MQQNLKGVIVLVALTYLGGCSEHLSKVIAAQKALMFKCRDQAVEKTHAISGDRFGQAMTPCLKKNALPGTTITERTTIIIKPTP